MKKGGFLRNVLDTIRSNQANQGSQSGSSHPHAKATDYGNQLKSNHFSLAQVARHGFPENPTAFAFDPVQKLACIGTKSGALKIFGRPGVDVWVQHKPEYPVTHIKFIVNQGAIITVTADESIHLWSLCGPNLKLQFSANSNAISPSQSSCSKGPSPTVGSGMTSSTNPLTSTSSSLATAGTTSGGASSTQIGDPNFLIDHASSTNTSSLIDHQQSQQKYPEILHTLKFQREHITCLHLTLADKWLYIGTEKGNVHVANVETFELSGYSIAWNKAIELSRKNHPGSIIHLSECPQDTNKILIGYESGCIVLWDLKNKTAESRYYYTENLVSLAWHYEGKHFMAAHGDGSLVTWQKANPRPVNIVHPHAKSPSQQQQQSANSNNNAINLQQQQDSVQSLTSTFARSLNTNEYYKPINKVDWKTTKHQEQLLIFSGGLPHDGINSVSPLPQIQQQQELSVTPIFGSPPNASPGSRLTTPIPNSLGNSNNNLTTNASLSTPATCQSPISPSKSPLPLSAQGPTNRSASACSRQSTATTLGNPSSMFMGKQQQQRSTSLTVMLGKSITNLEMDDTIVDFITLCDNSPYENDTVEALAVIVLLSSDFIVIDLTTPTYPSFESPYPSSQLRDSPVTSMQYLADCNQDLIPFLYSSSQNVISGGPKRGYSEREWPINGGEWGQSMQSYPELVITGHADGSLKFWDMSSVNFDLISKVKTSRYFEKPNELPESMIIDISNNNANPTYNVASTIQSENPECNYFAIEKIEYYPTTKHLVVAGAMAQVIQFRLTKKDAHLPGELTTIPVESLKGPLTPGDQSLTGQQLPSLSKQHSLLRTKTPNLAAGPATTSSATSRRGPADSNSARFGGFQAELICLTSMIVSPVGSHKQLTGTSNIAPSSRKVSYYCHAPPKVTAIALNENHNM